MKAEQVPLSEAALRLGIDYHQCRRMLLRGDLSGGRDEFGRLYVDRRSVDAVKSKPRTGQRSERRSV